MLLALSCIKGQASLEVSSGRADLVTSFDEDVHQADHKSTQAFDAPGRVSCIPLWSWPSRSESCQSEDKQQIKTHLHR